MERYKVQKYELEIKCFCSCNCGEEANEIIEGLPVADYNHYREARIKAWERKEEEKIKLSLLER